MPKYILFQTRHYLKSLKKLERSGRFDRNKLETAVEHLIYGISLPVSYRDHALSGEFSGYRECHIESDLLLVYEIDGNILTLTLINIGSHSYLFG